MSSQVRDLLMASNDEFRRLVQEHSQYSHRLESLITKRYLSEEEKVEEVRLKKLKLRLKIRWRASRRNIGAPIRWHNQLQKEALAVPAGASCVFLLISPFNFALAPPARDLEPCPGRVRRRALGSWAARVWLWFWYGNREAANARALCRGTEI